MNLKRRQFAGLMLAAPIAASGCTAQPRADASSKKFSYLPGIRSGKPLLAPKGRQIRVAFAINSGFQVIDMAGPWEVFQDTYISETAEEAAFEVFTVSETPAPVPGTGGLKVVTCRSYFGRSRVAETFSRGSSGSRPNWLFSENQSPPPHLRQLMTFPSRITKSPTPSSPSRPATNQLLTP